MSRRAASAVSRHRSETEGKKRTRSNQRVSTASAATSPVSRGVALFHPSTTVWANTSSLAHSPARHAPPPSARSLRPRSADQPHRMSPLTRAAPTASPATASAPLRERSNPLRAGSKRPAAARRGAARATARLASPSAAAARASRTRVSGTLPRRGASLVPTAVADPPASSTAPAEAGGAADFDWHNQWYPVAFLDDLDDSAPLTSRSSANLWCSGATPRRLS